MYKGEGAGEAKKLRTVSNGKKMSPPLHIKKIGISIFSMSHIALKDAGSRLSFYCFPSTLKSWCDATSTIFMEDFVIVLLGSLESSWCYPFLTRFSRDLTSLPVTGAKGSMTCQLVSFYFIYQSLIFGRYIDR